MIPHITKKGRFADGDIVFYESGGLIYYVLVTQGRESGDFSGTVIYCKSDRTAPTHAKLGGSSSTYDHDSFKRPLPTDPIVVEYLMAETQELQNDKFNKGDLVTNINLDDTLIIMVTEKHRKYFDGVVLKSTFDIYKVGDYLSGKMYGAFEKCEAKLKIQL